MPQSYLNDGLTWVYPASVHTRCTRDQVGLIVRPKDDPCYMCECKVGQGQFTVQVNLNIQPNLKVLPQFAFFTLHTYFTHKLYQSCGIYSNLLFTFGEIIGESINLFLSGSTQNFVKKCKCDVALYTVI